MAHIRDDVALGDLFADLARETSTLARQEFQLAKAELRQSAEEAARSGALLLVGGAVAFAGFLALLAAVILKLGEAGVARWLAALSVGLVVAVIGGLLIGRARSGLHAVNLAPQATIESLKEDQEWARDQIS